ncbi:MAG: response regulator transcription factor [Dechloromonas sp.]|jgi:DNA-binding NarL/FixJ family response regulator|nr:response regulator transcription factor [Dechloromonas sp.]
MIRILIADDHNIVRSGLKQIVSTDKDMEVVGEAGQGSEVLSKLQQGGIDLLLTDLSMPGICSLDLIHRARAEAPKVPIIVLSMHNESQLVSRVLRAGAAGYVDKGSDPATLLAAIRKVAMGGRFIDPSLVDGIVFGTLEEAPPHAVLSDREYEVLQLLNRGLSLTEIGSKLFVSAKTVSTHKARMMQKLGIDNNADLVRYALKHGMPTKTP